MASGVAKLIPSDPEKVMVIRRVTPDILTCSTPFLRFGRIKVGGRGTIVRLATGNLAVFSPVALTDTVKRETQELGGNVGYIVALDQEHHIFLESWHKAYPEAKVLMPDTLPSYRDKQSYFKIPTANQVLFYPNKKPEITPEFDADFDYEYVHAHGNKELVFNHRKSGTLIEADLLFNLPATEQFSKSGVDATSGVFTKLFNFLQNTRGDAMAQRRVLWYGLASPRPEFNGSIKRINAWSFDRIIPCHGDVIESGGKGIFEKIMAWHLDGKKSS
ncbi:Putative ribonuclease Z/Hydroxyacylglutathione hydrolase [Septoria linicola]|uniref:Ribonuclease Z/Hydroxyacylglutathione hydrolase n=1 Tax=Septoria linicola TaxID=215465 RepID=A0A9Q9AWI4_9PEZI|nr:Putative ribonuclease Z/Hydroxyacylglutathione hydrolase [Septoria linicola]